MSLFSLRLTTLLAIVAMSTLPTGLAYAGPEPEYGDNRGDTPKNGQNTEGHSYRKTTFGEIGTGSVLPGSLGGSTVTTPEGLMNSGSYGVPAPGSGLDLLHKDEMKRLREHQAHKKAAHAGHADEATSGTDHADAHGEDAHSSHGEEPKIVILPAELTSPLNRIAAVQTPAKRSLVRDHAVAASPLTPGQGGARRDRSIPSTTVGPRLASYPSKASAQPQAPIANVAGVAWGRPVAKPTATESESTEAAAH